MHTKRISTHVQHDQEQGTTRHASSLTELLCENKQLRRQLEVMQLEKAKEQKRADDLDDQDLDKAMKLGDFEILLREQNVELDLCRTYRTKSEEELEYLTDMLSNGLSPETEKELREYLRKTTMEIQLVTERSSEMQGELTRYRAYIKDVQDEADTKVMKMKKQSDLYFTLYHDEAVHKTDSMYKEIIALNAELGRDIQPKEQLVRNQRVADRFALRFAAEQNLWGVDTTDIPAEYYKPGFIPGHLPATHDALRALRPLGWVPVFKAGKVYLQPMYKAFTEEDAVARLQAQELRDGKVSQVPQAPSGTFSFASVRLRSTNCRTATAK